MADALFQLLLLVHVTSIMLWLGGMLFLVLVLIPVLKRPRWVDQYRDQMEELTLRFSQVGWIALAVAGLTGVWLLHWLIPGGLLDPDWSVFTTAWGRTFLWKLGLVALIIALSALHEFWIGPRAFAALEQDATSPEATRLRRIAGWVGRAEALLGLVIVGLALSLPRGGL